MTFTISRRAFLAGTATLGAASIMHPFKALAGAGQAHLRLMETTDLHVAVYPYDYFSDAPNDTLGLGRTAALINSIRNQAGNSLLLDNGDVIQGNPMGDYIAYEKGLKDAPHPIIAAMNTLGYDMGTVGNHEFNYGLDFLKQALSGANFPVVCANLAVGELGADPLSDKTWLHPYRILEKDLIDGAGGKQTIKLGFIGFVPPQILTWDATHLAGRVATRDIVETAKAYVPKMKAEGADLIVALSHSGIAADGGPGAENASLQLAAVDGIDVVFTGHQHLVFPNSKDFAGLEGADLDKGTLAGKPAVMAGFWGSHMGLIDLLLEKGADGKWTVLSHTSEARPIFERVDGKVTPTVESLASVLASAKADHEATLDYVRRPVGQTSAPSTRTSPSSPTIRACRSSTSRRNGTSKKCRRARAGTGCPSCQPQPRSRPAAVVVPTTTRMCPWAPSPSRTSPTCICIPTPSRRYSSPAGISRTGSIVPPASSTRCRRAPPTSR